MKEGTCHHHPSHRHLPPFEQSVSKKRQGCCALGVSEHITPQLRGHSSVQRVAEGLIDYT